LDEVEKDLIFYEESEGGITLSGGEPFTQFEFALELLKSCSEREIHTCMDTSGYALKEQMLAVLPFVDIFLFDIKLLDNTLHKKYTGISNRRILSNLEVLIKEQQKIIIRYPLIPGINDSADQLEDLHRLINNRVSEIHFLPYHRISGGKWKLLGLENRMKGTELLPAEQLNIAKDMFTRLGYTISIGG
jgi:pyruvate formate lyase activating enzyme